MQGQRSTLGPFSEIMGFDHGSSSNDAAIDQQICWSNMRASSQLSDYMLSPIPSGAGITHIDMNQEGHNLGGWSIGESSSSEELNEVNHNVMKTENGWSTSLTDHTGTDTILEEQIYGPRNSLSLNNVNASLRNNRFADRVLLMQRPNPDSISRDLNINSGFLGCHIDDCQVMGDTNLCLSGGLGSVQMQPPSSSPDPFGMHSRGDGFLEESDGRPGCFDGQRSSCKRKALEGHVGQSSGSGSSNYFQPVEDSAWNAVPSQSNVGSGSSTTLENPIGVGCSKLVNPRRGLGLGGSVSESPIAVGGAGNTETSQRNFRVRVNTSQLQDFALPNAFPTINNTGASNNRSCRLLLVDNSLDLMQAPTTDNIHSLGQSIVNVSNLRQSLPSSRWNAGSSSRSGSPLSYVHSGESDTSFVESNSRRMPRNIVEHSMFAPFTEIRNSAQNPMNWSLDGGNTTVAGNVSSVSRTASHAGVHALSSPNWVPSHSPPQYSRRMSEIVRRSLLSAADSEVGGQSNNQSSLCFGPSSSSQEMALSSGSGSHGHRTSHSWSTLSLERQLHGAFGASNSLQTLAAASEGRSRLPSEIRNVLDLMRRGEGLRIEDVMVLDQSVFFGMNDYDRHRDMRLDIDNMSYEELLALEERIGNVCTGLSEETILNRLKQRKYLSIKTKAQQDVEPCCICQEEYNNGEDLGKLDCGHDFHTNCIKQWLMRKNLCPICKMTGLIA